jgi:HK97 family phage portal protein
LSDNHLFLKGGERCIMHLWNRIKSLFTTEKRNRHSNFTRWFEPYNIFAKQATDTLATNETIFAAITRLSNSMASLPLKLYQNFSPIHQPIADMITHTPNSNMTSFDFIRTMEVHRNVYGNAYALKKYNIRYQIEALLLLDPTRVTPVIEKNTNDLYYEVQTEKERYFIHNLDIIHVKHIHSNGYKGISPLNVLRNSIHYDSQVKEFSLTQMESGIKASFILKLATHLGNDKKKTMLDSFKQFYSQNGGVILLDQGMELEEVKRNFIDMKVFEVEKITRSRVATVFNIPLHMLGETEGASFSSMEQMSLEYVQNTLLPIVRMYEQELNRKLLTEAERLRGLTFKFNINALLRGDTQTRAEFYFKGIRSGWFTPNEVRAYEELPPFPGGETLYMSKDLSPIHQKGGEPEE